MRREPGASLALNGGRRLGRVGRLVLLVILISPLAAWLWQDVYAGSRLRAAAQQASAAGLPLNLADALPEQLPDGDNAWKLYESLGRTDADDDVMSGRAEGITALSEADVAVLREWMGEGVGDTSADVAAILSRDTVRDALRVIDRAARMPNASFPLDPAVRPDEISQYPRLMYDVARLASAQSAMLARQDDSEGAMRWCVTGLRACRQMASQPTIESRWTLQVMFTFVSRAVSVVASSGHPSIRRWPSGWRMDMSGMVDCTKVTPLSARSSRGGRSSTRTSPTAAC